MSHTHRIQTRIELDCLILELGRLVIMGFRGRFRKAVWTLRLQVLLDDVNLELWTLTMSTEDLAQCGKENIWWCGVKWSTHLRVSRVTTSSRSLRSHKLRFSGSKLVSLTHQTLCQTLVCQFSKIFSPRSATECVCIYQHTKSQNFCLITHSTG